MVIASISKKACRHGALPVRVVFGRGTLAQIGDEIRSLKCSRALILLTAAQERSARDLAVRLGGLAFGVFAGAVQHTPVAITEQAMALALESKVDCLVGLGGGSTTGLSKAIAVRTDLPQIVVPTTYAGSEATPILGETENGTKTTRSDPRILPEVIVYDVDLTLSLPLDLTVTSGFNAIAHAAEALYARDGNSLTSLLAEDGIRAINGALPRIFRNSGDEAARSDALYGAWACGTCLGTVGMALHHKLCHVLGGTFDLPHAENPHRDLAARPRLQRCKCSSSNGAPCKGIGRG